MGTSEYQELAKKRAGIERYPLGTSQEVQDRSSTGKGIGTGKDLLKV
jgi:hypothetical protein